MDHLHCMKMKKMVPLYDLLLEMLDAHIMHSSRLPHSNTTEPTITKESPRTEEAYDFPAQPWVQARMDSPVELSQTGNNRHEYYLLKMF